MHWLHMFRSLNEGNLINVFDLYLIWTNLWPWIGGLMRESYLCEQHIAINNHIMSDQPHPQGELSLDFKAKPKSPISECCHAVLRRLQEGVKQIVSTSDEGGGWVQFLTFMSRQGYLALWDIILEVGDVIGAPPFLGIWSEDFFIIWGMGSSEGYYPE